MCHYHACAVVLRLLDVLHGSKQCVSSSCANGGRILISIKITLGVNKIYLYRFKIPNTLHAVAITRNKHREIRYSVVISLEIIENSTKYHISGGNWPL